MAYSPMTVKHPPRPVDDTPAVSWVVIELALLGVAFWLAIGLAAWIGGAW